MSRVAHAGAVRIRQAGLLAIRIGQPSEKMIWHVWGTVLRPCPAPRIVTGK